MASTILSAIKYCGTAVFCVSVVSFAAKSLSVVSQWLFTVVCDNYEAHYSNDWFEGAIYWHYVLFKAQENYIGNARKTQNCFMWQCHAMTQTHYSELLHTTLYKCGPIRHKFSCNIPEQCRSHLLYGRSLKSHTANYSLYFNLISLTGRLCPVKGNFHRLSHVGAGSMDI
jgi:hypothetical protein